MSIVDLAKRLQLSSATVSLALKGDPRVAAATRQRVLALAKQTGYQANEQARNLRLGRSGLVALVVWGIATDFWAGVVSAAESELAPGCNLVVCNTGGNFDKEVRVVADLAARRVDGIILQPADADRLPHLVALREAGTPVVLLERGAEPSLPVVKGDDAEAAREAVKYLVSAGRRRLLFLSPKVEKNRYGVHDRADGFRKEVAAQEVNGASRLLTLREGGSEELRQRVLPVLANFDAVLCAVAGLAVALLPLLAAGGIRVPDALAVLSWDDFSYMEFLNPPLTGIRIPVEEIGRRAAQLIRRQQEGEKVASCFLAEEFRFRATFPQSGAKTLHTT